MKFIRVFVAALLVVTQARAQGVAPVAGGLTYVAAICGIDNTTLVQGALNSSGLNGRIVLPACPQASPIIITSLTVPNNTALLGAGRGVTWLQQAAQANAPFLRGSGFAGAGGVTLNTNIEVGGFSLDGNGANQSAAGTNRCLFFLGVGNLNIHDIEVLNCRSDAVSINGNGSATASPNAMSNIYVSGTVGAAGDFTKGLGVTIGNRARNSTVKGIFTENTAGPGILIDASEGTWSDLTARGAGTGTSCTNSGVNTVNSPGGGGASQSNWTPCPPGIYFRNVTNISATNLIATQCLYYGVVVIGARHTTVSNLVSTQNSLAASNTWDDLHFDYNVFVSNGYGENSEFTLNGAQLGANGQTAIAASGSPPTSRYGLFIADGQTGAISDIPSIATPGTGYTFNDSLTISGGTSTSAAKILVTGAPGGTVTIVQHDYSSGAGVYSVLPSNPVSVTGGTGSGATFNVTWSSAYMTGINIGPTVTAATRIPSFITGSGWNIQTSAGNVGP